MNPLQVELLLILLVVGLAVVPWTGQVVHCREPDWAQDIDTRNDDDVSSEKCSRTVDIYQSVELPPVTDRNFGKPLHCVYRIRVRPAREDWVVFVRFTRMRAGVPQEDRQACDGGYIQIVDGYTRETNISNRENPGFYCGEIDSPKTFISETPYVKVVFHADEYGPDTYMQFEATVKQQQEVASRYGQYSNLYPHRRGQPVQNTYCHRLFKDCAPGRCFVQSPAYPGIYPRGLSCKFRINMRQSLVGLDLTFFDVDGLRCDNLLMCFPRPISRDPADCPFDYVRVFDGPTEDHPVITTLCGRGRLKSNIVASSSEMLVTFVSSPAGPLLNTGFHFKADSVYDQGGGETIQLRNGACIIERSVSSTVHSYNSIRSWYPANTSCQYRFTAPLGEIIHLEFTQFRVERVTFCEEAIRIYDSHELDPRFIITKNCDTNRPRSEAPRTFYESTSNRMLVDFSSTVGSLDGSSITFSFEVKHVSANIYDNKLTPMNCNKKFKVSEGDAHSRGSFSLGYKDFIEHSRPVGCNYSFDAREWPHGRVQLTISAPFEVKTDNCDVDCPAHGPGRIEIFAESKHEKTVCLCRVGTAKSHRVVSIGPVLDLGLRLKPSPDWHRVAKLTQSDRMLEVSYIFYSDTRCGPERLGLDLQGSLHFPPLAQPMTTHANLPVELGLERSLPLYCRWTAPLLADHDVSFRLQFFHALSQYSNCSANYLLIDDVALCPNPPVTHTVLLRREHIHAGYVPLEFRSKDGSSANFSLWWTQVKILPTPSSPDTLVSLSKDCEFLCTQSMVCLKKELVCNGVPNCPPRTSQVTNPKSGDDNNDDDSNSPEAYRSSVTSADEDPNLCQGMAAQLHVYWWIIGSCIGLCIIVGMAFTMTLIRRCVHERQSEAKEEDVF
ncbi:uncharacterized protein LOC111252970 isoform X2 [Varroa destructor]|uniref:CUB domain-containing protein n=1 Tax=Varroa destructor TaxID=109461 RepID=A0A7M7KIP8_VARDE|nr:uncharacterized protein LOC111252970 isoform X2 [Varroa destructor]